jgi:hypothetical protein
MGLPGKAWAVSSAWSETLTRQHHGVQRGDALRVMEANGVVAQAALTKIFRQQIPRCVLQFKT